MGRAPTASLDTLLLRFCTSSLRMNPLCVYFVLCLMGVWKKLSSIYPGRDDLFIGWTYTIDLD